MKALLRPGTAVATLISLLVIASVRCDAQPSRVPRVSFFSGLSAAVLSTRVKAFRTGLNELGYVEGENITIEYHWGGAKLDHIADLAADPVRLKPDVIVTSGPPATRAARAATKTIPIVMAFDTDPVGNGFVANLGRPGGNITGLSAVFPEISGKRLELLRDIVPSTLRVAVLGNSKEPANAQSLKETELAAESLGLKLLYFDVLVLSDIEAALRSAKKARMDAALVLAGYIFNSQRTLISEHANNHRVPTMYQGSEYVEAGGLISYGTNIADLFRRAATYVDKILKVPSPPICRSSNRPSLTSSST